MSTITLTMLAETASINKGIADVNNRLGVMSKTTSKVGSLMKTAFVTAGAAMIGSKVVDFFGDAISEARESQKVMAQTAAVLKSTGHAAGISAKQVGDLATAISNKTGIDDEAIQTGENLLLTFTNVRNEVGKGNDVFNQATMTATDMSAALGQDMKSSVMQLGKALNDPIKGISALSRVGVSFTEQQKKQVEALVKSGKTLEAQKIILGEVKKEFGGSAEAIATPGQKLAVVIGNIKESIGTALLPILDTVETYLAKNLPKWIDTAGRAFDSVKHFLSPVGDAFGQLVGYLTPVGQWFKDNPELMKGAAIALGIAAGAAGAFALAMGAVVIATAPITLVVLAIAAVGAGFAYAYKHSESFRNAIDNIVTTVKGFAAKVVPVIQQVGDKIREVWQKIKPDVLSVMNSIKSIITDALGIVTTVFRTAVSVIMMVWDRFGSTIVSFLANTFENLFTVIKGAFQVISGIFHTVLSLLKGDWKGAWDGIKQILKGVWNIIKGVVKQALNIIKTTIKATWIAVKALTAAAWNGIKALLGKAWDGIKSLASKAWEGIKNLIGKVWDGIKATISRNIEAVKNFLSRGWDAIKSGADRAWEALKTGVTNALGKVVDVVKELPGKLKNALSDAASWLVDTGKNVVEGIWNGIQSMSGWLTDKVWDWVKSVLPGPVEKALGISSPSKVFAEIGRYSVLGLAAGLGDRNANRRVSAAAKAMLRGMAVDTAAFSASTAPVSGRAGTAVVHNHYYNGTFVGTSGRQVGQWVTEAQDSYLASGGQRRA